MTAAASATVVVARWAADGGDAAGGRTTCYALGDAATGLRHGELFVVEDDGGFSRPSSSSSSWAVRKAQLRAPRLAFYADVDYCERDFWRALATSLRTMASARKLSILRAHCAKYDPETEQVRVHRLTLAGDGALTVRFSGCGIDGGGGLIERCRPRFDRRITVSPSGIVETGGDTSPPSAHKAFIADVIMQSPGRTMGGGVQEGFHDMGLRFRGEGGLGDFWLLALRSDGGGSMSSISSDDDDSISGSMSSDSSMSISSSHGSDSSSGFEKWAPPLPMLR